MSISRVELRMKYKAETAFSAEPMTAYAKRGRYGAVILEEYLLDERFLAMAPEGTTKEISLADNDYVAWLEEKLMELLPK